MRKLAEISNYTPAEFLYQIEFRDILRENVGLISKFLFKRIFGGRFNVNVDAFPRFVNINNIKSAGADIIYSHRHRLPINSGSLPIIWFYSVADPRMQLASGVPESEIAAQYETQGRFYRLATKVQVTTDAEVKRHAARFPELADRFVGVPWFRPGLTAISSFEFSRKHYDDRSIRVLFVGREARRKGLDILLDGIRLMSGSERKLLSLDIVSSFSDGFVDLDLDVDIRCHREIDNASLFGLFRRAHVYAMPCRFETFGLAFVEAMSHGCAVLGPDWEVQQEILDFGRAGINTVVCPEAICAALREICFDQGLRIRIGASAIDRFSARYSPSAVAKAYYSMFEGAVLDKRSDITL